jgi:hypothetical protein
MATDHSPGPPITQRSTTLGYPIPKEGEDLLYKNSDKKLEYPQLE